MEITITGKQIRVTEPLRRYIYERASKAEKYLSPSSHLVFTLKTEKYRKIAEVHLNVDGSILQAEGETDDMQASVDRAVAKIERQLNRHKEKISDHRVRPTEGKGSLRPPRRKKEVLRVLPVAPVAPVASGKPQKEGDMFHRNPLFRKPLLRIKRETARMEILTLEEAVSQIMSDPRPFFLFRNRSDQRCHLLYRRGDGPLTLIEGIG